MAEDSKIQWCDHTFNPWIGCTKVSPGCDNCYAEAQDKHRKWTPEGWGSGKPRKRTSPANWKKPLAWNRKAKKEGRRYRVFCASLADVFDNEVPREWRRDLYGVIRDTSYLDWLLLTKRIGNVPDMPPDDWGRGYSNVRLGMSIVNQAEADRDIPRFLMVPTHKRFLSCEPLLGPLCFRNIAPAAWRVDQYNPLSGRWSSDNDATGSSTSSGEGPSIDWVIVGGESGPNARPFDIRWAESIIQQCDAAGVPVFIKQLGARPYVSPEHEGATGYFLSLKDKKGADMFEWPPHLRRRDVPI